MSALRAGEWHPLERRLPRPLRPRLYVRKDRTEFRPNWPFSANLNDHGRDRGDGRDHDRASNRACVRGHDRDPHQRPRPSVRGCESETFAT